MRDAGRSDSDVEGLTLNGGQTSSLVGDTRSPVPAERGNRVRRSSSRTLGSAPGCRRLPQLELILSVGDV